MNKESLSPARGGSSGSLYCLGTPRGSRGRTQGGHSMRQGIKQAAARARGMSTGRKRVTVTAMLGAAIATVVGLAVPAGASPLAARPAAVTGAEHFQVMSTSTANTPNSPLIAWGVFTAAGIDRQLSSN